MLREGPYRTGAPTRFGRAVPLRGGSCPSGKIFASGPRWSGHNRGSPRVWTKLGTRSGGRDSSSRRTRIGASAISPTSGAAYVPPRGPGSRPGGARSRPRTTVHVTCHVEMVWANSWTRMFSPYTVVGQAEQVYSARCHRPRLGRPDPARPRVRPSLNAGRGRRDRDVGVTSDRHDDTRCDCGSSRAGGVVQEASEDHLPRGQQRPVGDPRGDAGSSRRRHTSCRTGAGSRISWRVPAAVRGRGGICGERVSPVAAGPTSPPTYSAIPVNQRMAPPLS